MYILHHLLSCYPNIWNIPHSSVSVVNKEKGGINPQIKTLFSNGVDSGLRCSDVGCIITDLRHPRWVLNLLSTVWRLSVLWQTAFSVTRMLARRLMLQCDLDLIAASKHFLFSDIPFYLIFVIILHFLVYSVLSLS